MSVVLLYPRNQSMVKQMVDVYACIATNRDLSDTKWIWTCLGVGDVEHFLSWYKQRLVDISTQEWHSDITENRELDMYILNRSELSFETFVLI